MFGHPESGKTSLLRLLARSITARATPQQAKIVIADYRRTLLAAVTSEHLIGYGASAPALTSHMAQISEAIKTRLPGPDVTMDQLRARKWWTGPDLVLLIDDYDLIAATANPLEPLIELLPQASDLGLHLVITRRTAGASRAMYKRSSLPTATRTDHATTLIPNDPDLRAGPQLGARWRGGRLQLGEDLPLQCRLGT